MSALFKNSNYNYYINSFSIAVTYTMVKRLYRWVQVYTIVWICDVQLWVKYYSVSPVVGKAVCPEKVSVIWRRQCTLTKYHSFSYDSVVPNS